MHIGLKIRITFFPRDLGFQAYATIPASTVSLSYPCVCIIHYLHAHLCCSFNSLPRFATRWLLDYFSHLDSFCAHRLCVDVNGFAPSPPLFEAVLEWILPCILASAVNLMQIYSHLGRGKLHWWVPSIKLACVCIFEAFFSLMIDVGRSHPIVCGAILRQVGLGYTGKIANIPLRSPVQFCLQVLAIGHSIKRTQIRASCYRFGILYGTFSKPTGWSHTINSGVRVRGWGIGPCNSFFLVLAMDSCPASPPPLVTDTRKTIWNMTLIPLSSFNLSCHGDAIVMMKKTLLSLLVSYYLSFFRTKGSSRFSTGEWERQDY